MFGDKVVLFLSFFASIKSVKKADETGIKTCFCLALVFLICSAFSADLCNGRKDQILTIKSDTMWDR